MSLSHVTTSQIAPRLSSGLGNRLFQFAATIKTAEETARTPVIFLPRTSYTEHGNFDLLLDLVSKVGLLETASSWKEFNRESEEPPKTDLLLVQRGYCQDLKFFPDFHHPLLPALPATWLLPPTPAVAIHFRFGDYCQLQHHQVDLSKYYMKAIRRFPPNTSFTLFSDSPVKLRPICDELCKRGILVKIAGALDTRSTLIEIASCAGGAICSNSTFAWWAAFLAWRAGGYSSDYKAFVPAIWMAEGEENHRPRILNTPFTQVLELDGDEKLMSFEY